MARTKDQIGHFEIPPGYRQLKVGEVPQKGDAAISFELIDGSWDLGPVEKHECFLRAMSRAEKAKKGRK